GQRESRARSPVPISRRSRSPVARTRLRARPLRADAALDGLRQLSERIAEPRRNQIDGPGTKTCARCRETLPVREFYGDSSKRDGLQSYCIDCKRAYNVGSSTESLVRIAYRMRADVKRRRSALEK